LVFVLFRFFIITIFLVFVSALLTGAKAEMACSRATRAIPWSHRSKRIRFAFAWV
jgi:hypothetical protein